MLQGPNDNDVVEELVSGDDHGLSFRQIEERSEDENQLPTVPSDCVEHDEVHPEAREETGGESREPTFSSEEGPTSYPPGQHSPDGRRSPGSAFSSPAPSTAFTPTPAFLARPRARFNVPLQTPFQLDSESSNSSPVTPHTRRRSFLVSVINSDTRPRLRFPTPHPRRIEYNDHTTGVDEQSTPGANLLSAFAGVTPRRPTARTRLSHPLAQTYLASPLPSVSASPAASGSGGELHQWSTTPSEEDRASFISTASSHDLTAHHRVNTSFDPVMGLGAQGHGVGRFNAGKLNTYLHGLNRRLQQENEGLVERLNKVEEEKAANTEGRRLSGAGGYSRRVSLAGSALGDVEEDVSGEGWVEEKAELEKMVDAFREEMQNCIAEREAVEKALEEERGERARDKERWRERMVEVEKGVEVIIRELESKMKDAEKHAKDVDAEKAGLFKELHKKMAEIEWERDAAIEKAQKTEQMLENGRELGGELKDANKRVEKLMVDLRNANVQIRELEDEVMGSDGRIDELEKGLKEEKNLTRSLKDELQSRLGELAATHQDVKHMEEELRTTEVELQETKVYTEQLEEDAGLAVERIETLEKQMADARARIEAMTASEMQTNGKSANLAAESKRNSELAKQMEVALEAADKKMTVDEEQIADLREKLASLQRQREQEYLDMQSDPNLSRSLNKPPDAEVEALEDELEKANREIGRLNALLNQSPARKAMEKAKDTKIELLEIEREELLGRVQALRSTLTEMGTPNKVMNTSGISPIHRQALSMSIRAPKTPGGPLRDVRPYNVSRKRSYIFCFRCHG